MTYRILAVALGAAATLHASPVRAQAMDHGAIDHSKMDHAPKPPPEPADPHAGHAGMEQAAMPGMAMADGANATAGSGSSRIPGADGMMHGLHLSPDGWDVMLHGYAWGTYSDQGGPRGDEQAFVTSMAMVEGSRDLSDTTRLQLRGMFSLDPLIGDRGYPNLFATGETAGGEPLVDRQHPHDFFMELSARIDTDVGGAKAFVYGGPVAEPALGPSAFMHRASAALNPEAPITHHWFDSTHITFGVVTAGIATDTLQLEGSAFRGREPDEARWDIETPRLDSWSVRSTWTPSPNWAASLSYGRLESPEVLHPGEDETRLIATLAYSGGGLAVTGAYGRKDRMPGPVLDAWLVEANWSLTPRHTLFGRFETVENDELFEEADPLHGTAFRVSKFTLGYAYAIPLAGPLSLALGGSGSLYAKPAALDAAYGRDPKSFTVFAKLSLGG